MSDYHFEKHQCVLRATGVHLTLGEKKILRDVNLQIDNIVRPGKTQGQVVGLLGPSGMGKTQLFRLLAGLNTPDEGTVEVGDPLQPIAAGQVGVVAQDYPLFQNRTVMSNLLLAGRLSGSSLGSPEERAKELLSRFDLAEHGDKYPVQLSGGQKQRVAIAQQFMCSEHYLLMDEPFSGLDPIAVDALCHLISEIAAADEMRTFIIVTHDITSALRVCDTLWLLGRDRGPDGKPVPGARIQEVVDLIARGLAWRPDIHKSPEFFATETEVHDRFATL
ncbi:MAG: ABC transporter ATP-binding protein [Armatimonadetes bacterium]|nr:ABC transporter ATP-binding protein [Armatimonadota bacterium]